MIRTTFLATQSRDENWLFFILKIKSNEIGR